MITNEQMLTLLEDESISTDDRFKAIGQWIRQESVSFKMAALVIGNAIIIGLQTKSLSDSLDNRNWINAAIMTIKEAKQ